MSRGSTAPGSGDPGSWRRWTLALGVVAVLGASGRGAAADELAWTAPAGCPDAAAVRARIDARLAPGIAVPALRITVTHRRGGYVASIDPRGWSLATAMRTLTSTRCDELADAVAVIVARLAGEAAASAAGAASPDRALAVPRRAPGALLAFALPPRPPDPLAVSAHDPTSAGSSRWGGGARALAVSGIGGVPHVGLGGELAGFVYRREAFLELALARWRHGTAYLAPGAPGHVDVGLRAVAVRGGWASQTMPLRAWLGVELGEMTGRGVALVDPRNGSARWTAVAGGFGVAWAMARHVKLVGTIELAVPTARPRFQLGDGTMVYEPPWGSARSAFGIEVGWR